MLAGRIDVAKHYISTGGPGASRELYDVSISRLQVRTLMSLLPLLLLRLTSLLQSFGRYMFNLTEYPQVVHKYPCCEFRKYSLLLILK